MWVLIYFPTEKKSSVVKESLILPKPNGRKPDPGDEVFVKWNTKKLRAKLLRYSSTKTYLEKLNVDVRTGDILTPQVKSAKVQNSVERQRISKSKKASELSKAVTQKKHEELLLEKMDGFLPASGGESLDQTDEEETNAQNEEENPTKRRRIGDDSKPKDFFPEGTKEGQFFSLDGVFSQLTVTPQIVTAFEYVTNSLREHLHTRIVPPNPQVSSQSNETKGNSFPEWRVPSVGKVQLGSSGVWVDSGQLRILTTSWQKNPNELARRLFKWLVGEHTLARTSALGGGPNKKQALDPFLRTAVAGYVEEITGRKIEVNRLVNLMCGKLAAKIHGASTKSGEPKSAPNAKDSAKTLGKNLRETIARGKKTKLEAPINSERISSKSEDFSVDRFDCSREKRIKKTSTPTDTESKKVRQNSSSGISSRRSLVSFNTSINGISPINWYKNSGNNTALTKSGERRIKSTDDVSATSGDFSVMNCSRENGIKKKLTPNKTESKNLHKDVSSQLLGRRSSSSIDKSAHRLSLIETKNHENPQNNNVQINAPDARATNQPGVFTDLLQAGPNKEKWTGLTHPPPAVAPQLFVPEMQPQWGYSHFGYQQTYPPSPQYANYQPSDNHFPPTNAHHHMNYFYPPSDNCALASPTFHNL